MSLIDEPSPGWLTLQILVEVEFWKASQSQSLILLIVQAGWSLTLVLIFTWGGQW